MKSYNNPLAVDDPLPFKWRSAASDVTVESGLKLCGCLCIIINLKMKTIYLHLHQESNSQQGQEFPEIWIALWATMYSTLFYINELFIKANGSSLYPISPVFPRIYQPNSFPKISIKMWADELKKPSTQEITKTCLEKIILLLLLLFLWMKRYNPIPLSFWVSSL